VVQHATSHRGHQPRKPRCPCPKRVRSKPSEDHLRAHTKIWMARTFQCSCPEILWHAVLPMHASITGHVSSADTKLPTILKKRQSHVQVHLTPSQTSDTLRNTIGGANSCSQHGMTATNFVASEVCWDCTCATRASGSVGDTAATGERHIGQFGRDDMWVQCSWTHL